MQKHRGFTLIEVAIVLVIIGLILGGILKGQELITQAKIRNVINDYNGTSAAYYAYQDRYRAIPGDDARAAGRWTAGATTSGNGDGQIAGAYNAAPAAPEPESRLFWQHLRLAGLVAGPATGAGATNTPQNAASGVTGVQNGALGLGGLVVCSDNLDGKIASAVDSQFDDGNPATGQVRGVVEGQNAPVQGTPPAANYVDDGATIYVVCKAI